MEKQCTLLPHTRRIDATFQTPADSSREPFLRDHHCSFNTSLRIPPSSCSTKKAHHPCTPLLRIPLHELIMLHPITPWKKKYDRPSSPGRSYLQIPPGPAHRDRWPQPVPRQAPTHIRFPVPRQGTVCQRFHANTQARRLSNLAEQRPN